MARRTAFQAAHFDEVGGNGPAFILVGTNGAALEGVFPELSGGVSHQGDDGGGTLTVQARNGGVWTAHAGFSVTAPGITTFGAWALLDAPCGEAYRFVLTGATTPQYVVNFACANGFRAKFEADLGSVGGGPIV